jgi:predicted alpha/beta-fold hydrolase
MHQAWKDACREEVLTLPGGDRVVAYFHLHADDPGLERPAVLHLHGLEGSAEAAYQRGLSAKTFAAGFHSVRLNFRNCGDHEELARGFYFGARTEEVEHALGHLHRDRGFRRVMCTGVSLGGNMLLHYLADLGDRPPPWLIGAAAVSPPIEMADTCEALTRGWNRMYDLFFLVLLYRKLRRKVRLSPGGDEYREYLRVCRGLRSLREFDDRITARLGGYENGAAYYQAGSSGPRLGAIRGPTLIIHAQDDPFLPVDMFLRHEERIDANPWLKTAFPAKGGHVGFWSAPGYPRPEPWCDERWSENEAVRFLRAIS